MLNSDCIQIITRYINHSSYLEFKLINKQLYCAVTPLNDQLVYCYYDLRTACRLGYAEAVQYLAPHYDIRQMNNECLHAAAPAGHLHIVKLLVKLGLTLDDIRSGENCAFRLACQYGHVALASYLISLGLTRDDMVEVHHYAIIEALEYKHFHIIALLAPYLTLADLRYNNNAIIQRAAEFGQLELIKLLVSLGLTLDDICSNNNWAIRAAYDKGYYHVVEYLINRIKLI